MRNRSQQIFKAISLPLPLPLPPSKKKGKTSLTVKKTTGQERNSAKDLELDTFKRQEGCLLYSGRQEWTLKNICRMNEWNAAGSQQEIN